MGIRVRGEKHKLEYRFRYRGEPIRVSTGLVDNPENRKQAERMEQAHREQLAAEWRSSLYQPAVRGKFSDCLDEFVKWYSIRRRSSATKRLETSLASLEAFLGQKHVHRIHARDIDDYVTWRLNEHGVRPVTARHDVHALSVFFNWAITRRLCNENPTKLVDIPSDKDSIRIHVVSEAEERAYFEVAKPPLSTVAKLILLQGMRPGEILSLKKGDVDVTSKLVKIREGKTAASRRTLKLADESVEIMLRQMKTRGPWLFPAPADPSRHMTKLNGAHGRVLDQIGSRFVLYDFRHTFATRMAQIGTDLMTLAALLGHSSTAILFRYVHPTQPHMDAAIQRYSEQRKGL